MVNDIKEELIEDAIDRLAEEWNCPPSKLEKKAWKDFISKGFTNTQVISELEDWLRDNLNYAAEAANDPVGDTNVDE